MECLNTVAMPDFYKTVKCLLLISLLISSLTNNT